MARAFKCECAGCRGLRSAHPRFGYDKRQVARTDCLMCNKPIGRRHYMLFPMLARFGRMFVAHKSCAKGKGWVTP